MFFSDVIYKNNENDVKEITEYLAKNDVEYDFPERTYVIRDKGEIIATGSVDGNILKYFYANEDYQGQGLMLTIYNSLLNYLIENNINSFFVFTTPDNTNIFKSLGLTEVLATEDVVLFEGGFYNYDKWIEEAKKELGPKEGTRGSIIMNCNPMTLGHKYLIERASKDVDELIIFMVEEDKSVFPLKYRYDIVKNEISNMENVKLIKGGPYIISQATFPTYFIKKKDDMLKVYTDLDGSIFAEKIAKDLEIDKRFLGSEPTDLVTQEYNRSIKNILEENKVEVEIIERKEIDGEVISASKVRELIGAGKVEESFKYLPKSTIDFLESDKGKNLVDEIISNK